MILSSTNVQTLSGQVAGEGWGGGERKADRGRQRSGERGGDGFDEKHSFQVIPSVLIDNSPYLMRCWPAFEPSSLQNVIVLGR